MVNVKYFAKDNIKKKKLTEKLGFKTERIKSMKSS